ncbi:MAG: chemotaxis protein CheX [Bacillaceae bacterium]|nr:chemotaxis protein CheX [Bacillaceae bacterium]
MVKQKAGVRSVVQANYINPFLESAQNVFEQVCQVAPKRGDLEIQDVKLAENHIWIKIGVTGEMQGNIIFGLHEQVALRIISAMMGGMTVTEIDEVGKSAISELGNMISGNASTILYNQGITVDISPPEMMSSEEHKRYKEQKALTVPMELQDIGKFQIQVIVLS